MERVWIQGNGSEMVSMVVSELRELERQLSGRVLLPRDAGYDRTRKVWNGMFDRKPAVIVRCETETDVAAAVKLVHEHDLRFAVKGGGHSVAGHSAIESGVLIDLSNMRAVTVDAEGGVAHVQGGALWADVDRATQEYGLMTPGGEVSVTGVAGLTLGGGVGLVRRKYGLSCDNVASFRIVTATGELLTASAEHNPELYWALQGGGGNFGVVTSFSFRLFPLGPRVFTLSVAYPWQRAEAVGRAWRDLVERMPNEVSTNFDIWSVPALPDFPEEMHGTPIVLLEGYYAGDPETGARMMDPLRRLADPLWDESGTKPYIEAQSAYDPFFNDGDRYFFKSHFLDRLSDESISRIVDWAARRINPRTLFVVRHLGGAISARRDEESAFANRGALYNLSIDAAWSAAHDDDENTWWVRACWDDLARIANGGVYLNFAGSEAADHVADGVRSNMERLARIKAAYDPDNIFRMNANIRPALLEVG